MHSAVTILQETLLRIPIAEVANICYIQDDSQALLALKYGNPAEDREICKLAVMYADKPVCATVCLGILCYSFITNNMQSGACITNTVQWGSFITNNMQ